LDIPVERNDTIAFEAFIETDNFCCVLRFPLIVSCYKIVDSQTSSMGVENFGMSGVGSFYKVGVGVGVGHFTSDSATLLQTKV